MPTEMWDLTDGYNIGMLIMCAVERFFPEMIDEGRLCWLRTPLYTATKGKKHIYYFTDEEYEKDKESGKINGYEVSRQKGIGSNSPAQARESMFGKNQRMEVLDANNEAIQLLRNLMGKDVKFRRQYIFDNIDFSEVKE